MKSPARYLIGIDLGTTNSVVAYVDNHEAPLAEASSKFSAPPIHVFKIPQLAAPGELRTFPSFPSFLYFPSEEELASDNLTLPWSEHPRLVAGVMAREQGGLVPGRQVASAKSWLCHPGVDRRAPLLPTGAETPRLSPVEASAHYLLYLRDAWNHVMAAGDDSRRFEQQEIVLTVPASFDAEARELTVEAARYAGFENFTLLEEPLAAFYAWIAAHPALLKQDLRDGELILICDVGGGTTDFSLVRTRVVDNEVQFERTAIGEHLLLGGDNLDLALARRVEAQLGGTKLTVRQRQALRRACCAAKERLLSEPETDRLPITVLGGGHSVVGQVQSAELHREDVIELLASGFLPLTAAGEMPTRSYAIGLRELGLPYADDPAITRHLAAFLTQAAATMQVQANSTGDAAPQPLMVRPDAILFNGGFCTPDIARERLVKAIAAWFPEAEDGWRPRILPTEGLDSAVAKGAAYYGRVRHGAGLRIRAGSPRTYYIGLRSERGEAVCVLPIGIDEGTTLQLTDREFAVLANRPVSFALYSSRLRHDAHGAVMALEAEPVHRHAPLVTLLRYGKKLREIELAVRLRVTFTELGTLELWCEALDSEHQWRLQFELRGDAQPVAVPPAGVVVSSAAPEEIDLSLLKVNAQLIEKLFGRVISVGEAEAVTPATLVGQLESALDMKRERWPLGLIRHTCDLLMLCAGGRKKSPAHEVRWLNLLGFCLRPGFGVSDDAARLSQVQKVYRAGPAFAGELQSEVEWLVLWRRIAGGVNASLQQELYRKYSALLRASGRNKRKGLNPQIEHGTWRLLAGLEHLSAPLRTGLGKELLLKMDEEPEESIWLGAMARLGARIPLYGPISCVVPGETVSVWLRRLLELPGITPEASYAILQLGRKTGDSARDIDDALRHEAGERLAAAGVAEELLRRLREYVPPERADAVRMFGETLPPDMHLVGSANCLLPVTGLLPDTETTAGRRS